MFAILNGLEVSRNKISQEGSKIQTVNDIGLVWKKSNKDNELWVIENVSGWCAIL